jgi:hypothetical protein
MRAALEAVWEMVEHLPTRMGIVTVLAEITEINYVFYSNIFM